MTARRLDASRGGAAVEVDDDVAARDLDAAAADAVAAAAFAVLDAVAEALAGAGDDGGDEPAAARLSVERLARLEGGMVISSLASVMV